MKSKSHFFHDLDLTSILEPADPNDKNYSATKVGRGREHSSSSRGGQDAAAGGQKQQRIIACPQNLELCVRQQCRGMYSPPCTALPHTSGMARSRQPAALQGNTLHRRRR